MPRSPRRPPQPPLPDDEEQVVKVSEKMDNAIAVAEQMSGEAESAMICSQEEDTKEQAYLATVPIEQYSMDYVRAQFGSGRYVVTFLGERSKIIGRSVFKVGGNFKGAVGVATPPPGSPAAPGAATMSPEVAMLLGQMKGFEALIASQGVMMQGLISALAGGKNGKDPLDIGMEIGRIISDASKGAPQADRLGVKDLAETFREGITLGQSIAGPPNSDSIVEVAKIFGPSVAKAIDQAIDTDKAGKTAAAALPPAPAPAQVAPPKPGGTQPVTGTVDLVKAPWLIHLRPFIKEIEQGAVNGWDADTYVAFMASRMPDAILDEIHVAAEDPNFIENAIGALPPAFQAYKAWLTKALKALKREAEPEEPPTGPQKVEDEDEDEDEPGSAPGQ